jgi:fibronectin type 3 domain-containing protein
VWESQKPDKYIATAYQAIYGEDFKVEPGQNLYMQIKNQTEQKENRFSFALFACDNSLKAAELSGLVYNDNDIRHNEKYVYYVYINAPAEEIKIDTGKYFVDASQITVYPRPLELSVSFGDSSAVLQWNRLYYTGIYSSWTIFRSDDGGLTFKPVNKNPFVYLSNGSSRDVMIRYRDTLPANGKKYYYFICGNTAFGELGPPSDTVSGVGFSKLPVVPEIKRVTEYSGGQAYITWDFPQEQNSILKGFKIVSSDKFTGFYKSRSVRLLEPDKRFYLDAKPAPVNYYKVVAVDTMGNEYPSVAYMYQPSDSIPPSAPTGLGGIIDSNGVARIYWNKNPEPDVSGYRVYIANSPDDEFSQITRKAIRDTVFSFKTTLKTLTHSIYVKVYAEDNRFNPSDYSEVLELKRPDTIRPSAPLIRNYEVLDNAINLQWSNSSSEDVVREIVLRKEVKSSHWDTIVCFSRQESINSYRDTSVRAGKTYLYTILSEDAASNVSDDNVIIQLQMPDKKVAGKVEKFKIKADRDNGVIYLHWSLPTQGVKAIYIYRREDDGHLLKYKTLYKPVNSFTDRALHINTRYEYKIRFEYDNGKSSEFSESRAVYF